MTQARSIQKGQAMSAAEILPIVQSQLDIMKQNASWLTAREKKALKNHTESDEKSIAETLFDLNDALLNGRDVFAVCVKEPRGYLETCRSYFDVFYVNPAGTICKVWGYEFLYFFIGQEYQDRNRSISRFVYVSSAIGMSRLLDATDGLFVRLKSITGTYAQIC